MQRNYHRQFFFLHELLNHERKLLLIYFTSQVIIKPLEIFNELTQDDY